ncbi:MAG: hypothetical protein LBJ62_00380 [Bifidobacteriaceae bacterium]|nr:hypothetical protein [Bifidobacteriaceae bacterium]
MSETPLPRFKRPVMMDPFAAGQLPGGVDPAVQAELAHSSAQALVTRARRQAPSDPAMVRRLLDLVQAEGVEIIAGLWAQSPADSLPGALWRVYMLREWVRRDPSTVAERYKAGVSRQAVAQVVAGAEDPPGPDEMIKLADAVLSGVFTGDLDVALSRAGAFARIVATGSAMEADWMHETRSDEASVLTGRAAALLDNAEALDRAARRWRRGDLD